MFVTIEYTYFRCLRDSRSKANASVRKANRAVLYKSCILGYRIIVVFLVWN